MTLLEHIIVILLNVLFVSFQTRLNDDPGAVAAFDAMHSFEKGKQAG